MVASNAADPAKNLSRPFPGRSPPWLLGKSAPAIPMPFSHRSLAALWRFSQASPWKFSLPSSAAVPFLSALPPSFLFLGINRSRWEDSTRGERIRLFPFLARVAPTDDGHRNSPLERSSGRGPAEGRPAGSGPTNLSWQLVGVDMASSSRDGNIL